MPFTSETGKQAGIISRRGKSLSSVIKNQITEVAEELIKTIDIASLSNKDKVLYLKAIMPFILSKHERIDTHQLPTEFQIEIVK